MKPLSKENKELLDYDVEYVINQAEDITKIFADTYAYRYRVSAQQVYNYIIKQIKKKL